MGWNRKPRLLTVVMLCVAGCTSANYRPVGQKLARAPQRRRTPVNVSDAAIPQILPSTYFAAGRMFEAHGQLDKAIEQYQKAIAVGHTHVPSYHHLGLIRSKLQQHDEAITLLSKAVALQPDNAALRNNLGFELMFKQRWSDAETQLKKAISLQPRFARAHINLGMTLSKVGRFDDALAHFRAVLPEQDAQYNMGLMYRAAQHYTEAATAFRLALECDPQFGAAQTQLADIASHLAPEMPAIEPKTDTPSSQPALAAKTTSPSPTRSIAPTRPPVQSVVAADTARRQFVPTPKPSPVPHVVAPDTTRAAATATPEPHGMTRNDDVNDAVTEPLFAEEAIATLITDELDLEAVAFNDIEIPTTVLRDHAVIDETEDPCEGLDDITAMTQAGTLPTPPINLLQDASLPDNEGLSDSEMAPPYMSYAYSDQEELEGSVVDSRPIASTPDIDWEADPCENEEEEYVDNDLSGRAVAAPQDDELARMPFGSLSDEVERVDNEVRCLLEEALEAIAQSSDGRREPISFEPIASPPVDESIADAAITESDEPFFPAGDITITPDIPEANVSTYTLEMPAAPSQTVATGTPQAHTVEPQAAATQAVATEHLPLDWRSRMNRCEQRRVAIRSELDCLTELDDEQRGELLATATVENPPANRNIILVADKPQAREPLTRERYPRSSKMTRAYVPQGTRPMLAAPPSRSVARRHTPVVIHQTDRLHALPLSFMTEPMTNESDIFAAIEIGPAIPTQKPEPIHVEAATGTTTTPRQMFNWNRQFGDLEDVTSVAHNEIRCFEDMEQTSNGNQTMSQERSAPRRGDTRATPVRFNGRRNPF